MASCGPIPHRECPPLRTVRPGVRKRGRLRRGMGPNCPYMRTARPGVRKRGRLPCGMGLQVSMHAYSPARCAQAWTLTVRNGAKLSIYAYSPAGCAQKQGDAVGDEPRGREPLVRCDTKQGDGGGPSRDVAEVAGVRGGGASHCRNQHSATSAVGDRPTVVGGQAAPQTRV
jgi:hypothetical protein